MSKPSSRQFGRDAADSMSFSTNTLSLLDSPGDAVYNHIVDCSSASWNTKGVSMASPAGTQAVDRAVRLLTAIVEAPSPLDFSDLVASAGLVKSTTSRLLQALERGGLVIRTDGGKYKPGEVFIRYAWRSRGDGDLVEIAQPFLDRLSALTGETINVGIFVRDAVEQIAQVDSTYLLGGTNWVGRSVPVHCSALGKVLLAYGSAVLTPARLEKVTPKTITNKALLETQLSKVREQGYAVSNEELEEGLVAVAAPIFAVGTNAVAALSVSGPTARLNEGRLMEVAMACMKEAESLSRVLGSTTGKVGAA